MCYIRLTEAMNTLNATNENVASAFFAASSLDAVYILVENALQAMCVRADQISLGHISREQAKSSILIYIRKIHELLRDGKISTLALEHNLLYSPSRLILGSC